MVHVSNINTLDLIYYAYFHSVIKCGIIFGCNSSNNGKVFTLQKKIIRIVAGTQPKTSYRSLSKQVKILSVPCQYILSLMNFFISNQEIFQPILSVHNINARNKDHLHRPIATLSCFQERTRQNLKQPQENTYTLFLLSILIFYVLR